MINKWIAIGRLTKDVEIRYTPSGISVAHFTIAVNRKVKDKEEVLFMDCIAWDKRAEVCSNYLRKGGKVGIEGSLYQESWEKDGVKHSRIKCRLDNIELLDSKTSNDNQQLAPQEQSIEEPF